MDAKSLGRNSPVLFCMQIEDFIRHEIATGSWKPGERIPSGAALDTAPGIPRIAIRGVLNGLVNDGLLQYVPGKSTFVAHQKITTLPPVYKGVREQLEQMDFATIMELVGTRRTISGKAIRNELGIASSAPVHKIVRWRSIDSHLVSLHHSFVPVYLASELEHDGVLGEQLYVILENKCGLHSPYIKGQLGAVAATKKEADLLGLRLGVLLLLLQDAILEILGRVSEFSEALFRDDRIRLHFGYRS